MERPVFAPRGDPTGRNQGLERPIPARRQRAHAPPESVICSVIVFTGTLAKPASMNLLTREPILKMQTALVTRTPKLAPILTGNSSATSSSTKRCASASSSTVRADKLLPTNTTTTTHSPTKALSAYPRVLRRVQAVIEVPIKQEEEEDGAANRTNWPGDAAAALQPTSTPTGSASAGTSSRGGAGAGAGAGAGGAGSSSARRRKSSASSHQRSQVVPPSDKAKRRSFANDGGDDVDVDDDDDGEEEDEDEDGEEEPQTDEGDDGGECVDEEEVEIAIASGTPATAAAATGQKTIPWGRKHVRHEPDEEDDELMMYAKVRSLPPPSLFPR